MPNNFCLCETCETEFYFGALDADQDCSASPDLSQISGLLIVPDSAALPSDWESRTAWEAVVDNDSTDNSYGKYLTGIGSIDESENTTVEIAKGQQITTIRLYTFILEVYNLSNTQYQFMLAMQCNPANYTFWPENVSGHLWGGSTGIAPTYTNVAFPLGAGDGDVEKAVLTIQWRATCDPPRTYIEGLSENFAGTTEITRILGFSTDKVFGFSVSQVFGF